MLDSDSALIDVADVAELEMVHVRALEIVMDESLNSRSYEKFGSGQETEGMAKEHGGFTDEQLRDDIAKNGLLQPIGVRLFEGAYVCVYGYRRLRACLSLHEDYPVSCIVQASEGDEERDSFEAHAANVRENMNRRNLKPFELAEALFKMTQSREDLSVGEIAQAVGIERQYANHLVLIRKRAAPKLWRLFVSYGLRFSNRLQYKHMIPIVKLPKLEQVAAWQSVVAENEEQRRQRKSNPRRRATIKTINQWLAELDSLGEDARFVEGVRYALQAVNGEAQWKGKTHHRTRRHRPTNQPRREPAADHATAPAGGE